jgi:Amt family ammonium transporter
MSPPKVYSDVVYTTEQAIDAVWVLISMAMVFQMQAGFTLLECGSVRKKNSSSILIKNLIDSVLGCLGFWFIGYAFAFGGDDRGFIGNKNSYFFGSGFETEESDDLYLTFLFQFAFANTAATIVSGCLAERIHV